MNNFNYRDMYAKGKGCKLVKGFIVQNGNILYIVSFRGCKEVSTMFWKLSLCHYYCFDNQLSQF